jgi:hypothetical protein
MSFSQDINEFVVEIERKNELIVKQTVIKLFRDIIFESPVDTGRFRGNWFLTYQNPSRKRTKKTDRQGNRTVNAMADKVMKSKSIRSFILTNNLPYSEVIEFGGYPRMPKRGTWEKGKGYVKRSSGGYSKLAPNGVVRVNMIRFRKLLEEEAKRQGYGNI